MSFDPYKRYYSRGKDKDRKMSNQEILFGITQKDIFKQELLRLNRLTGNKGANNSMPKKKNTIIHSNSTNHIKLTKEPSNLYNNNNMKENSYNIININVNNLIINNNSKNNNNNINKNQGKVFSKIGNDIIDGKNLLNIDAKRNKMKVIKEYNNQKINMIQCLIYKV